MTKRSKEKLYLFGSSLLIILAFIAIGCGSSEKEKQQNSEGAKRELSAQQQPAEEKKVVEFKYPDNPSFDLIYIADELGYFEGTGVKPKYVGKVAAPQIIPSVATGAIDFGNRHTPLAIAAIAAGSDVKIVAAGTQTQPEAPHMKYFVRRDSPIKGINDLVGKKIGINSFGACSEYVTKKYLKDNGLEGKVKFLVVPNEQLDQSLKQGLIDVAIIHPPHSGRAEKLPELRKLWSDWDIDQGISGMNPFTVNGKFARENPEAVKVVITALAKAAKWTNENPDEARKIIAKRLKMNLDFVERYGFYEDQLVPKEPVQYWIDRLEAEGKLKKGQVKLEDIYTNEYNPFYQ